MTAFDRQGPASWGSPLPGGGGCDGTRPGRTWSFRFGPHISDVIGDADRQDNGPASWGSPLPGRVSLPRANWTRAGRAQRDTLAPPASGRRPADRPPVKHCSPADTHVPHLRRGAGAAALAGRSGQSPRTTIPRGRLRGRAGTRLGPARSARDTLAQPASHVADRRASRRPPQAASGAPPRRQPQARAAAYEACCQHSDPRSPSSSTKT